MDICMGMCVISSLLFSFFFFGWVVFTNLGETSSTPYGVVIYRVYLGGALTISKRIEKSSLMGQIFRVVIKNEENKKERIEPNPN